MFKRDTGTAKRQTGTAEAVEGSKRGTQNLAPQKDLTVNFTEFNVTLLTDGFQARAVMRCIGLLAIFLNDDSKPTFPLYNAEIVGLDPANPATRVVQDEAFFRKLMCHAIAFESIPGEGHLVLLPREESLVVYTSQYAIQGKFHLGPDDRVGEFMEVQLSQFVTITDAHIYPLFQPRTPMIAAAPLVMLHRSQVRMYHKVGRS